MLQITRAQGPYFPFLFQRVKHSIQASLYMCSFEVNSLVEALNLNLFMKINLNGTTEPLTFVTLFLNQCGHTFWPEQML